jgi:hypothetical protein
MVLRQVRTRNPRRRFLYDCKWLVLRAGMRWDRWGFVHENVERCHRWFDEDPCWMRAYQVYMLIHQVAAYTGHPDLRREDAWWLRKMKELDVGLAADVYAASKLTTHLDLGLTAGELKRLRKRIRESKPNWKWDPNVKRIIGQIDGRLGRKPKTHRAA